MFFSNCAGCLQVPVPVHYWSPYISPAKKSTFHIADILHQQMTNPVPQVCQNVTVSRKNLQDMPDIKYTSLSGHSKRTEFSERIKDPDRATNISKQKYSHTSVSENVRKLKQRDSVTCSLPSALAPLQALCTSGVQYYSERSKNSDKGFSENINSSRNLKFGINRILSEDFGKETTEKENNPEKKDHVPESSCDCSEYRQLTYSNYALTAVNALQPPRYPASSSGTDTLPGPYSILNTDVNNGNHGKRKRSWSRAVFSNLQRKGLEKRFEVQKYVTKPDRRQLAAMLGLTDAQVKVWFQNRRMKWRHTQQQLADGDKDKVDKIQSSGSDVAEEDMEELMEINGDVKLEPNSTAKD